ncbi:DNA-directed RNA polymerase subunit omega [Candidatus Blochmannia ocreatus]|uniref:DNA-directed RNA polymerase subunit omega n=1 Tax=Candidatus Blochmannia ocreatus (nom. nud.) TaxID=251538 RepID=A0ABY4SU00_9ENTR|nr:DNA-directed RNA polymerase subunit omega [Candidatus Blochmannia ocreatus]URJ25439.1 DNA-directed RNA polymerase subunit omega [Candidatus Blochmannia ocreatus]
MDNISAIQSSVESVNNKFDLILVAARRARQMQFDEKSVLSVKNNYSKYAVLALKELEDNISKNNY